MTSQTYRLRSRTRRSAASGGSRDGWVRVALLGAIAILLVAGVVVGASYLGSSSSSDLSDEPTKVVARGDLLITVVEDGNLESGSNVDVKCQVAGGSSILWIIPDGEYVEAGDKIIELDSSALDDQINQQRNVFEKARATKIQAEQDFEVAKISVDEYLQGTFLKDLQDHDKEITIAKENLRGAQSGLEHAQMMFRKGYVSQNELEAQEFAVKRSELELASAETAKMVLENFTKVKTLEDLESQRDIAEARMNSEQAAFQLEESRLKRLEDQLEHCLITAPQSGMVVYANERGGRFGNQNQVQVEEGAQVRERQTLIRIPDLNQMQVKVNVHESKVEEIKSGMRASILVQGETFQGSVGYVANQPEPTSFFQGNVKEYATTVSIEGDAEGLKPGMTAEVTILIDHLENVLFLPLSCVVENGGKFYVWKKNGGKSERLEVQVGQSNESFVAIVGGLDEGEEVFENPSPLEKKYAAENASETDEVDPTSRFGQAAPGAPAADGAGGRGGRQGRGGPPGGGPPEGGSRGGPPSGGPPESGSRGGPPAGGPPSGAPSGGAAGGGAGGSFDLMSFDQDNDGKVTKEEAPEQMQAVFDRIDEDGDGAISKEEAAAAAARRRQAGGGAPQP